MPVLAPLMKKSSYLMDDYQKNVIVDLLTGYFQLHIQDSNGSYLATFDYQKINFNWCKDFFYKDSGQVGGAWTPMFKNDIFLRPSLYNKTLYDDFVNSDIFKKLKLKEPYPGLSWSEMSYGYYNDQNQNDQPVQQLTQAEQTFQSAWNSYCLSYTSFYEQKRKSISSAPTSAYVKDFNKYMTLVDLFSYPQNSIMIIALHELYHKYQYSAAWFMPIFYSFNQLLSQFIGYDNACNLKWTIEGDVRVNVDNESTKNKIVKFEILFNSFTRFYNYINNPPTEIDEQYDPKDQFIDLYCYSPEFNILLKIFKKYDLLEQNFLKQLEVFVKSNK